MSTSSWDVVVVGGGNAAFCAALAAREKVGQGARARARDRGRVGRQLALHRRADARGLQRRGRPQARDARPVARGDRAHGLRHLHRRAVPRRHGARHRIPLRPGPDRAAGQAQHGHRGVDALEGRALHRGLGPPGVQHRRQVQVLGRPHGRGGRRRPRARGFAHQCREEERHRDLVLGARDGPDRRRRGRAGRSRQTRGQDGGSARQERGARRRRLPGQSRMARALPRSGLGAREGPRHALQHRRRDPHGARHRRGAGRQLVGLPRGGLGTQRARIRRPRGGRPVPEALLSLGRVHQRPGQALRGRGRRLPQLHLRQVRPRDPGTARPVRLADLRRQGEAAAQGRIQDPAGDQAHGEHARRAVRKARGHRRQGRRWRN